MPLSKKWRSMDFFGSLENLSIKHHHAPFRSRLSSLSSGSKEQKEKDIKEESPRKEEAMAEPGSNHVQRCVIIQRDERGYGLTVSGDNPVFVQSVKPEGAAAKSGVQQGDKIVKVNGNLVLNRNHLDVVKLIKSGSYVVLTLFGKPPATSSGSSTAAAATGSSPLVGSGPLASSQRDSGSHRDSTPSSNRVTAPKPVDPEKDRELWQQKVHYLRAMYETAKDHCEQLQRNYVKSPSERLHSQLIEREKTVKALENQLKTLTGSADLLSDLDPDSMESSTSPSWASSFPNPISDSDSPNTSPCGSPTPNHPENTSGLDMDERGESRGDSSMSHHGRIISPEEDEFHSDEEPTQDHGPFKDISLLEKKPAHLAVFLHYLISNSDPCPMFFYVVSNVFSTAQGSSKELRKWAYEIYSTFLIENAPLRVVVPDEVVTQIDKMLKTSVSKDKQEGEAMLRNVFDSSRDSIRSEIQDLLADFCNKKDLGLANLYGAHELKDKMDKAAEIKTIEKVLFPHLENITSKEEGQRSDRDQAMIWALATVFRHLGINKQHSGVIDRVQSFVMKDKKSLKFPGTRFNRSKTHKGHQFNASHYYTTTTCLHCSGLIWGVGIQGYHCQICDLDVHKCCLEDAAECRGKKMKGKRPSSMLPIVPSSRKPSNSSLHSVTEAQRDSLAASAATTATAGTAAGTNVPGSAPGELNITTQPYPRGLDEELAGTVNEHSVKSIVNRYEDRRTPPGGGGGGGGTDGDLASGASVKKGTDLGRSESMKGRGEKGDRPARRAKSDVDVENAAFNTLNQSGSSSASSLSNRGIDSPGNSYDTVSDTVAEDSDMDVESELPTLKEVLGEDVLKKLKPKEKKRQEVINEFFHTESCHMRNLKILRHLFYRPLVDNIASRSLAELLFPNIDKMIQLHQMLNVEMKNRRKDTPVVQEVGDILLKRFDGGAGEDFKEGCAKFCCNQSFALDQLRQMQRKDYKLAQFLIEAESNPRCRRLQLKDLLPTQMQRLTKYPLLIDNLLKYTQQNSDEHRNLEMAQHCSRKILEHVNQAIRECENRHRLADLQKRMDPRPVESINDASLQDIKKLDLKEHRLVHDGVLMWRLRSHRLLEVHVVLLEDMMVILQKSDERLILKCHSTNQSSPDKFTHPPVLRLQNLLARNVATDKKSFFVVNTSETGPQIYELIANTQDDRKKWCRLINDYAEKIKSESKGISPYSGYRAGSACLPKVSSPTNSMTHTGDTDQVTVVRETIKRNSTRQSPPPVEPLSESESGEAEDTPSSTVQSGLPTAQSSVVSEEDGLIQPSELSVSDPVIATAQPVRAPIAGAARAEEPRSPGGGGGGGAALPMSQLKDMASEMQQIIKNLMSVVGSNREEKDRLRHELALAQEKIGRLREIQRSVTSGELPLSPSSLAGGVPFAGMPGEGLLGTQGEAGQGDGKRSSLAVASDDDGDDSNTSTTTTETTSEQATEPCLGERAEEERATTPDQGGLDKMAAAAGSASFGFTPPGGEGGLFPPAGSDDNKSDESDSDTFKASGAVQAGVLQGMVSSSDQGDSFSSMTSESTLLASSMMTTDLDEGVTSPEADPRLPAGDDGDNEQHDNIGGSDEARPAATASDCDLDYQQQQCEAAAILEGSDSSAAKECSGAEAFGGEAGDDRGSHGDSVPSSEWPLREERDGDRKSEVTDSDSSEKHTEPVEI